MGGLQPPSAETTQITRRPASLCAELSRGVSRAATPPVRRGHLQCSLFSKHDRGSGTVAWVIFREHTRGTSGER